MTKPEQRALRHQAGNARTEQVEAARSQMGLIVIIDTGTLRLLRLTVRVQLLEFRSD